MIQMKECNTHDESCDRLDLCNASDIRFPAAQVQLIHKGCSFREDWQDVRGLFGRVE
jgi:hypothetical protein